MVTLFASWGYKIDVLFGSKIFESRRTAEFFTFALASFLPSSGSDSGSDKLTV